MSRAVQELEGLRRRIAEVPIWYHAIELAPGVVTPGEFDMRPFVGEYEFPPSLEGRHVIDVGASNGFFAFHFERLGAARVVAVELPTIAAHDLPRWYVARELARRTPAGLELEDRSELDAGFELAHEVLVSRVERHRCTVYEVGAQRRGEFDFAFCGNLLQHLRDPVGALESIRETLKPGGRFVLGCSCDLTADASYAIFDGSLERVMWWVPSRAAILRMCRAAGFADVQWRGSFAFSPRSHPERIGHLGILHATAPADPGAESGAP